MTFDFDSQMAFFFASFISKGITAFVEALNGAYWFSPVVSYTGTKFRRGINPDPLYRFCMDRSLSLDKDLSDGKR